jgi:hypothetical protein
MLVDTSVPIRTLQPHHSLYTLADRAIRLLPGRGSNFHIVAQNLIELWMVATRPLGENGLGMTPTEAAVELGRIKGMFLFMPESHDARLVAAMQLHGLTAVLTFDRTGFARFPGIEAIHSAEVAAQPIGED